MSDTFLSLEAKYINFAKFKISDFLLLKEFDQICLDLAIYNSMALKTFVLTHNISGRLTKSDINFQSYLRNIVYIFFGFCECYGSDLFQFLTCGMMIDND